MRKTCLCSGTAPPMSRSTFLEFFELVRRGFQPTRLELNEYYSRTYGNLRVYTAERLNADFERLYDFAYLNDTTSWFLPHAPDIVIPQVHSVDTTEWRDGLRYNGLTVFGQHWRIIHGFDVSEPLSPDDLAATTVETLVPDTAPEEAPPRRKQSYEEWHAEATALLAEQKARHE